MALSRAGCAARGALRLFCLALQPCNSSPGECGSDDQQDRLTPGNCHILPLKEVRSVPDRRIRVLGQGAEMFVMGSTHSGIRGYQKLTRLVVDLSGIGRLTPKAPCELSFSRDWVNEKLPGKVFPIRSL